MALKLLFVHAGAEMYGADRILLELVCGLRENGHQAQVVLPGHGELESALEAARIPVHVKNLGVLRRKYFSIGGLVNRMTRLVGAVRFLSDIIRRDGIDVVHSNTTAVFAGAIAAKLTGVKHVWHVHEITTRPRWFALLLARCVALLSDKVVFVSDATRRHMCELNPLIEGKAEVIHNGIDTTRAVDGRHGVIRSECGWSEREVVVGMVGRINWWKGQGALIDCAEQLASENPDLRFILVGGVFEGEEQLRDDLAQRIRAAGLEGQVVMQDFRSDVGNVLADIDIFVLPSTEPDPFPTVVLEAMAAQKPIVAFRHGGVCEMVADGVSGILCTPCSTKEMASAIQKLAQSAAARSEMGKAGRGRLDALFTRRVFLERFITLYLGILGRGA